MELPDLPSNRNQLSGFGTLRSLRDGLKEALSGDIGPIDYELNTKGVNLQTRLNDALISGRLKPNGEWNLNVSKPVLGGQLDFNTNGENHMLRFNKRF